MIGRFTRLDLDPFYAYHAARAWAAVVPFVVSPVTFLIDAPFGRFTPTSSSIFLLNGIKSWIVMEIVSPICFLTTFVLAPISQSRPPLDHPASLLASLFVIHYINRALVSPLRTPSRSKSHISVPLSAMFFNLINGSLMGTYMASPGARKFLNNAYQNPLFYLGVSLWMVGFIGNVIHDEILLNIRRKAKAKNKAEEATKGGDPKGEHYAIPCGLLFEYVSFPNYFCEWIEWFGFALAAAPIPISLPTTFSALFALTPSFSKAVSLLRDIPSGYEVMIDQPHKVFPDFHPPWIFFAAEILLMFPRAYKGHLWYKKKFPDYPKKRWIVFPGLI